MKSINLISLAQAHDSLLHDEYKNFTKYYGVDIKNNETIDLKVLVSEIFLRLPDVGIFNDFYVGYKIKHISKEFDLLRFGRNYVLNVEIKSTSTVEKIKTQLTRNNYYLGHISKVVHNLCFVAQKKILYRLNSFGDLESIDFSYLIQLLTNQNLIDLDSPDVLFNPSDYLVSPFNSTDKFLNGQYFLTGQQEDIRDEVLGEIYDNKTAFISITGSAGTGKTLLTYDIVRFIKNSKNVVVVHCGQLNDGHHRLRQFGWRIVSIRDFRNYDLNDIDLVVVDEAQRIYPQQFDNLVVDAQAKSTDCIFSYDKQQTLSSAESRTDIEGKIDSLGFFSKFKLSEKIRTNKEIASFIKVLFNANRNDISFPNCGNVDFDYFTSTSNVKDYISLISNEGWEVLRLTPSQYDNEHHESYSQLTSKTSHRVIGQEFDNVAVVIDQYFRYDSEGFLTYNSRTYYDSVKMLFQNITRTRKKLKLIIIGNRQILNRCLTVLG
ncbi:ATP-binding protein [Aliidiomarina sanyensis]|nr:ATP-binding protein [Aliidiomarina sanyensis]